MRLIKRESFSIVCYVIILLLISFSDAQKLVIGKNHKNPMQTVIPHIKYGQGLNRWSFLSVDRENHGLHSDLLCPNPMLLSRGNWGVGGGSTTKHYRTGSSYTHHQYREQSRFPERPSPQSQAQLPNEIWAIKTDSHMNVLPCSLTQHAVPPIVGSGIVSSHPGSTLMSGKNTRHNNNAHLIENRILFINVSLVPFNFHGAVPCTKYIKLMYDEEEGTLLSCGNILFDPKHEGNNKYHINWPVHSESRKQYFSLLDNLERFLIKEQTLHKQFYFQIYYTSQVSGRSKRCTVQQYELDLSYPAGNARFCNLSTHTGGGGHEKLCGEFRCEDLIFPLYSDPTHATGDKTASAEYTYEEEEEEEEEEDDEYTHESDENTITRVTDNMHSQDEQHDKSSSSSHFSWIRMIRTDVKLLVFFTVVPLVLFGVLVFGLELIVYFMCCKKRREDELESGTRSQQLLENSLNVWENVPSRLDAQRTVSFSPMTTNIYGERKNNLQLMDATSLDSHPDTPKILKSALKCTKPGEQPGSPVHPQYFDYHDHDNPPSYIETTYR